MPSNVPTYEEQASPPAVAAAANAVISVEDIIHRYENRLRTTLTHEYGHVRLHAYLFALDRRQVALGPNRKPNATYCMRDGMLPIGKRDWMEWQAGYVCGALLMPKHRVDLRADAFMRSTG